MRVILRRLPCSVLLAGLLLLALFTPPVAPSASADGQIRVYLPVLMAGPLARYGWHTFYGSENVDWGRDVVTDAAGNVYVVGTSYDSWLGPAGQQPVSPHPLAGAATVILSLDAQGNYRWHTFLGGGQGSGIAFAPDGAIYVSVSLTATWRGPAGQLPLHPHSGGLELCVAKLDGSGHYLWHTFYGSPAEDSANSVAVDSSGNVLLVGVSADNWLGPNDEAPLHPFRDTLVAPKGSEPVILKLSAAGAYQWHAFYGAPSVGCTDAAHGVATGANDAVYVVGSACGHWSTARGTPPLHPGHRDDIFALKLSPLGSHQWHTFYGSPDWQGFQWGTDIALDGADNLYLGFVSTDAWNGDNDTPPIHPFDGENSHGALKLTSAGGYVWHTFYGGDVQWQTDPGIAVSPTGSAFVTWSAEKSFLGDNGAAPLNPFPGNPRSTAILALGPGGAYRWHTFYGSAAGQRNYWNDPHPAYRAGGLFVVGAEFPWLGEGMAAPKHPHSGDTDVYVLNLTNVD